MRIDELASRLLTFAFVRSAFWPLPPVLPFLGPQLYELLVASGLGQRPVLVSRVQESSGSELTGSAPKGKTKSHSQRHQKVKRPFFPVKRVHPRIDVHQINSLTACASSKLLLEHGS